MCTYICSSDTPHVCVCIAYSSKYVECVVLCVAAGMLWECVQCPQLTELDLKGCHLVELCDELQVNSLLCIRKR